MFGWLFNVFWTLWVVLGTVLEEKDLVAEFGEDRPDAFPVAVSPRLQTVKRMVAASRVFA
jgi:hypothetical protein